MSDGGQVNWFVVTTGERSIGLSVSPPGGQPSQAVIPWDSVVRVCFEAAGPLVPGSLYIFTSLRAESWVVPTEADGGPRLLSELIRRGLLDAGLVITASRARQGLFCWPPGSEPGTVGDARGLAGWGH